MIQVNYNFKNQLETENFARELSLWAKPGLLIALNGDLGAGKSTFARAFIKALAKSGDSFDIPSPTFSLVQAYENTRIPVAHIDLYRLSNPDEVEALGVLDFLVDHIVLVEWPKFISEMTIDSQLSLNFSGVGDIRSVLVKATGLWHQALERNAKIGKFLANTKWQSAERIFFEGDASSRRYETLNLKNSRTILMDMPKRPDGDPVKNGKPYSAIAHLAEDIGSVIAINRGLIQKNYSAPEIESIDLHQGLAVIEFLEGNVFGQMFSAGNDMLRPMQTAIELLADMANQEWSNRINLENGNHYIIPNYDIDAQLIEVDLIMSWFWPYIHGDVPSHEQNESFENIWRSTLQLAAPKYPHWVLRDFHSPNLLWLPQRHGIKRVGLIDTQDAVMGHAAYDLASLLQDARVDIEFSFADELYAYYETLLSGQGHFDEKEFGAAYAVLGAQRATKILGIFARLAKRDGKPQYLKHMPRVSRHLKRNLEHPALAALLDWYEGNMPEALSVKQP